jgi:hypothetical protein
MIADDEDSLCLDPCQQVGCEGDENEPCDLDTHDRHLTFHAGGATLAGAHSSFGALTVMLRLPNWSVSPMLNSLLAHLSL